MPTPANTLGPPGVALRDFLPLAGAASPGPNVVDDDGLVERLRESHVRALAALGDDAPGVAVRLGRDLPCLLRADRTSRVLSCHPSIFEAPSPIDAPSADGDLASVLGAALILCGVRWVLGAPTETDDADVAREVLRLGGPDAPLVLARLSDGTRFARALPPLMARRLTEDRYLDHLTGDNPYDRERAFRMLRRSADLSLLPRLQERFETARGEDVATLVVKVHRAIAINAYSIPAPGGGVDIRRSTLEGRLQRVDEAIVELIARRHEGDGAWRGVDLDAFRRSRAGEELVVADMAAADGTTTLELFAALRAAEGRWRPTRVRVTGSDVAPYVYMVERPADIAVFGADGRLIQRKTAAGVELPGPVDRPLEAVFATLSPGQRDRFRVALMNPRLCREVARHPEHLSFSQHDVFTPLPAPADVIRIFGLLYRRLRPDVDADSYFDSDAIMYGLRHAGRSLQPGGVLIVGNYVDCVDRPERYLDCEIWQRMGTCEAPALRLCERIGRGLGIGRDVVA